MNTLNINEGWQKNSANVFWAEIAPTDHVVQIYENDEKFLDLLFGFVSGGIVAKEYTIVIATSVHLKALHDKLKSNGFDLAKITREGLYISIDAEIALSKFMVNDWPDENLFIQLVMDLIGTAKKDGRTVRAFGEMVAILWAKGQIGATVRLEHLWNKFCETQAFCLFCAYPQSGFTQDAAESVMHICSAHSKLVTAGESGLNDIFFKVIDQKEVG